MAGEVPHRDCVRLLSWGKAGRRAVWHTRTGEHCFILGALSLHFDNDGIGFVTMAGDHEQTRWLNDFLDLSLHVDEDGTHFVYSKKQGCQLEFDLLVIEPKAFYHEMYSLKFVGEIYEHAIPVGSTHMQRFRALNHIQNALLGSSSCSRWLVCISKCSPSSVRHSACILTRR